MVFDFSWSGFWGLCALGTLLYSHFPIRPLQARNHVYGGEIMFLQWLVYDTAIRATGDVSPIGWSALIDLPTLFLLILIAVKKQAVWAAVCSLLHVAMLVLHFAYWMTGQKAESFYLLTLGGLFGASLLTINTAIFAGRHSIGERVDKWFLAQHVRALGWIRGWSWSGVRSISVPRPEK